MPRAVLGPGSCQVTRRERGAPQPSASVSLRCAVKVSPRAFACRTGDRAQAQPTPTVMMIASGPQDMFIKVAPTKSSSSACLVIMTKRSPSRCPVPEPGTGCSASASARFFARLWRRVCGLQRQPLWFSRSFGVRGRRRAVLAATGICPYRRRLGVPGAIRGMCAYPGRGDRCPSARCLVGIDKMSTTADTPQRHRRIQPTIAQRLADNAVSGIGVCIGASRPRNRQSATELCMEE